MPTMQDLQDFLSSPTAQIGMGMLGSTQTPGPAYQAAAAGAQQQQNAQNQQKIAALAYQQALARQNFNPSQYLLSNQAQQPQQAAGQNTQQQLGQMYGQQGGGQIAANTQTPYQPPQGAIGNVDMAGLLQGAAKAGMSPEEAQQQAQILDPMTAMRMKLLSQPAVAVAPGGQLVSPGLAQLGMGGSQQGGSGTPGGAGVLASNSNPPPDSPLAVLQQLQAARAKVPDGSPGAQQLDAQIAKQTGSWEQGNDADITSTATAIAHGKMPPLTGNAMRSAISQKVMAKVNEINPDYDAHNWAMNDDAVKAFATGPQGNQVRSLNVAVNHLATLGQLADALQNGNTTSINQIANQYKEQTGAPAPTNFNAAKQIVGDEVVKAVVGSGGAQSDRDNAQKVIDAANSPAQLKGVINTYQALLGGQLNGLGKQYQQTTGRNDFTTFLNQTTQKATASGAGSAGGTYSLDDIDAAIARARGK